MVRQYNSCWSFVTNRFNKLDIVIIVPGKKIFELFVKAVKMENKQFLLGFDPLELVYDEYQDFVL